MDLYTTFFKGDELSYLELFTRTTILYFMLFGSSKLMGFRQPGTITPYNFLMAAGISHIAAARMVSSESRLTDAMAIIVVFTLIHLFISYLYFKIPSITTQRPTILIKNGRVTKENLKKERLTIDNLFSIMRQKNASNLKNIDYLLVESSGDFSVAVNTNNLPITKIDMGINSPFKGLSQILIYKGKVDRVVLAKNNLTYDWINQQLKSNNISDIKYVFLGVITPEGKLYVNK